jgi:hypothetical protein
MMTRGGVLEPSRYHKHLLLLLYHLPVWCIASMLLRSTGMLSRALTLSFSRNHVIMEEAACNGGWDTLPYTPLATPTQWWPP